VKNQYFGDVNDYRKYGLLRVLWRETGLRCLVSWMLTPDDDRPDGGFTRYLTDPDTWRHYDQVLFDTLRDAVLVHGKRDVAVIESSGLLSDAAFFSEIVPDQPSERTSWFQRLQADCPNSGLVFLDPDNGIEVKSKRIGLKGSSKYVYWSELGALFHQGASLLVYQHFGRQERVEFTTNLAWRMTQELGIDRIMTLSTSRVLFLLAPQKGHEPSLRAAAKSVARKWQEQFQAGAEPAEPTVAEGDVAPRGATYRLF
jgi:hypothetical protein